MNFLENNGWTTKKKIAGGKVERTGVQLVWGGFLNSAYEDADDKRDENEDAPLSLNIDEMSETSIHSTPTDLIQSSAKSLNFDDLPQIQNLSYSPILMYHMTPPVNVPQIKVKDLATKPYTWDCIEDWNDIDDMLNAEAKPTNQDVK